MEVLNGTARFIELDEPEHRLENMLRNPENSIVNKKP